MTPDQRRAAQMLLTVQGAILAALLGVIVGTMIVQTGHGQRPVVAPRGFN